MADINIGTEEAPMMVPEGSPGALNYTQNIKPGQTVITPESMTPTNVAGFSQPTPTPTPVVPDPYSSTPITMTDPEKKAQTITEDVTKLNESLGGKTAFQQEQESKYGVDTAQRTITDLNARLIGLKNQEAAIPLLLERDPASQGVSQTILDRNISSALRDNAIQALTVSSLMAAASGQLSNAQSLADKAVAAKYGPIEESIRIKTANLNLILNSPEYSVEDKKRAQKQLDEQTKKQEELEKQKTEANNVNTIALEAAANGADAVTLNKIQSAKTAIEATKVAAEFLQKKTNIQTAATAGIKTQFVNRGGEFFDAKTGEVMKDPAQFFQKAGVSSFAEAYAKGLVTDLASSFTKTGVTSYDEWQLYKASGGNLSYDEYQTMDANRKAVRSSTTINNVTPETKEIDKFRADAADWISKLGADTVSWSTAFNAIRAKYPEASNELIDLTLNRDKYKDYTGSKQ